MLKYLNQSFNLTIIVTCLFMIPAGKFVSICLLFFYNILKLCISSVYKEDFKHEKKNPEFPINIYYNAGFYGKFEGQNSNRNFL